MIKSGTGWARGTVVGMAMLVGTSSVSAVLPAQGSTVWPCPSSYYIGTVKTAGGLDGMYYFWLGYGTFVPQLPFIHKGFYILGDIWSTDGKAKLLGVTLNVLCERTVELLPTGDVITVLYVHDMGAQHVGLEEYEENEEDLDKLGAWLRKVELRDRFGAPSAQEARAAVIACREDLEAFASSVYEAADHGSASPAQSGQ